MYTQLGEQREYITPRHRYIASYQSLLFPIVSSRSLESPPLNLDLLFQILLRVRAPFLVLRLTLDLGLEVAELVVTAGELLVEMLDFVAFVGVQCVEPLV